MAPRNARSARNRGRCGLSCPEAVLGDGEAVERVTGDCPAARSVASALNEARPESQPGIWTRRSVTVGPNVPCPARERSQGTTRVSFGVLCDGWLLALAGESLVEAADLAGGIVGVNDPLRGRLGEGPLRLVAEALGGFPVA